VSAIPSYKTRALYSNSYLKAAIISHSIAVFLPVATCFDQVAGAYLMGSKRGYVTLQETLAFQVPQKQKDLATLKKEHGDKV
jgi:hypothetical protein